MNNRDTIIALSTPYGIGALALIRLSGVNSIEIVSQVFSKKNLDKMDSHRLVFGKILAKDRVLDEVVLSIFRAPHSYTSENSIEISCHGSTFIIESIIKLLIQKGARLAEPGEFTLRAFLNGKLDLSQSEAVADLIAAETEDIHQIAVQQLKGGYSSELKKIRQELLDFASLLELELDFSEEDVEFVNRQQLTILLTNLIGQIEPLIESFTLGNALKKGIVVVIAGKPNAGKSTLLNSLIGEDKAIVSTIPGTTRDLIEVEFKIKGIPFRIIDTAGLRNSEDEIELLGIQKTYQEIEKAGILIYLFDPQELGLESLKVELQKLNLLENNTKLIIVANKMDLVKEGYFNQENLFNYPLVSISAKQMQNLDLLKQALIDQVDRSRLQTGAPIITNIRHQDALNKTLLALKATLALTITPNSGELLAFEIRDALYHLGTITGEVSSEELLGNIFGRFCIGK